MAAQTETAALRKQENGRKYNVTSTPKSSTATRDGFCVSGNSPTAEELAAMTPVQARRYWGAYRFVRNANPLALYVAAFVAAEVAVMAL